MRLKGMSLSLLAVYFFVVLNILACISNFYSMNSSSSTPSWFAVKDDGPWSLSMRDGNCRCTVHDLWVPGSTHVKMPTLSCDCNNSAADPDVRAGGWVSTWAKLMELLRPVCHPVEIVRECPQVDVAKACPPSVARVETVEVAKACPPSVARVETVEVAKACPPSVARVETVEVAKACPPSVVRVETVEIAKACPPSVARVETVEVEVVKPCPGVPWYADGRAWHSPPKFPSCTMDTCFNYSRCGNMSEPLVYTYNLPSPPVRYFQRFNESKYWTDDPTKACLFLAFLDTSSPWTVWPSKLPYWNSGRNHVLVTFADKWEIKNPPGDTIGNASIMGTIVYQTTYRPGFDIPIPLPGKAHLRNFQPVQLRKRKYFATFRGTRYLGTSEGTFRSSDAFRQLNNGEDVVVVTTCNQVNNRKFLEVHPEENVHCDEDDVLYHKYSFQDLMNTTFGLAPAGRQPASYRLIEVMSTGAIPVLIADNYVKPFDMFIHWHECVLEFPTTEMARIIPTLRELTTEDILKRQESCLRIYNQFLKDDDTLFEASMRALKERFMGVFPNFARTV